MRPSQHQPEAVLWDLDGTLVDTEHLWLAAETAVMQRHGYDWTSRDQEHCLGGPLSRVGIYMASRASDGVDPVTVETELLHEMEMLLMTRPIQWRPGAVELVAECVSRSIPLALVTASYRRLVDALEPVLETALARRIGIPGPVFSVTVAGDEVPATKPAPDPYLSAAHQLGVEITRCIVIEDSPTGVRSGMSSGAFVVAVPHVVAIAESDRCAVVSTLGSLTVADLGEYLGVGEVRREEPVYPPSDAGGAHVGSATTSR